jgi:Beta-lactamase enzyme family
MQRHMPKVMSLVVIVGSLLFLLPQRAHAQVLHPAKASYQSLTLQQSLAASSGIMNAVVYDVTHGRYYTYNAPGQFIAASSMKVPIMLTFLDMVERQGRRPSSYEMVLLRTMIENSNNSSASALYYGKIGGAAGVNRFMRRIGITGLYSNPNAWGWSLIYPLTMVKLLTRLYQGSILTAVDRRLALYLMEHVEADQRWGVGDTAPSGAIVAMKDGWVLGPDGRWVVNSSGIVVTSREVYVIAVYTRANSSFGAGQTTVRRICRLVASRLG